MRTQSTVRSARKYAISLDIGLSGDVPGVDQRDVAVRLGAGPTLIHKDLYAYNAQLNDAITDTATEAGLPLQHAVFGIFGTDSGALLREGVGASITRCSNTLHTQPDRDAARRRPRKHGPVAAGISGASTSTR